MALLQLQQPIGHTRCTIIQVRNNSKASSPLPLHPLHTPVGTPLLLFYSPPIQKAIYIHTVTIACN